MNDTKPRALRWLLPLLVSALPLAAVLVSTPSSGSTEITIRALEIGGPGGGTYVSPPELRELDCAAGAGHRFDVEVRDDTGLRYVATTLEGPALRSGAGRSIHHGASGAAVGDPRELSFRRHADTPFSTRPVEDTTLTLLVEARDAAGLLTRRRFAIRLRARSSREVVTTRIDRPSHQATVSFGSSWEIAGQVTSRSCYFQPERVALWHTIPHGVPAPHGEASVDSSGRFRFRIPARTTPLGRNVFGAVAVFEEGASGPRTSAIALGGAGTDSPGRIEVLISPIGEDVFKQIGEAATPDAIHEIRRPESRHPDAARLTPVRPSAPGAEKVKESAELPAAKEVRGQSLGENALQGIER
ncbi:MAG: hypothetical protein GY723_09675 [bacterium]|nr:hypothetical protein [bacterium]